MDKINLIALERTIVGRKVKSLRKDGILPGHVFGKGLETEHVSVDAKEFLKVFKEAGWSGVISLKLGEDKVRPVMIKGVQYHAVTGLPLNIDFYQVNLKEKVKVPVPLVLVGEEPESVKLGENIVLQTLNEVEVEALPTDLIEKIEVSIETLKNVDDAITVSQLSYNHETLTILAEPEEIVVKLAPAVTAEMEALLEEQAADTEAAAEEAVVEGEESPVDSPSQDGEPTNDSIEEGAGEESPADSSSKETSTEEKQP